MAATVLLSAAASLAACGGQGTPAKEGQQPAARSAADEPGGRVLDLADALSVEEEKRIARRLRRLPASGSAPPLIVLLKPEPGDSLERFGWAAGGGQGGVPLLVLVDPTHAQVRIEGGLSPEGRAAVASAMRERLRAEQTAEAVLAGLDRLEQLER